MSDEFEDEGEDEREEAPGEALASPRATALLLGHREAEAALVAAFRAGRMPHAWLIAGPRGIGKATLAFRFARFLLSDGGGNGVAASLAIPPEHPVFRRVSSGGHADLLVVERGINPRTQKLRSEIVVEDTRAIAGFLRLTPAESRWRVVIVDGADLMNTNASNALLKILEEPPERSVLLLVSDNPGRLLPTIRSRCRILALRPLPQATVEAALRQQHPSLSPDDATALALLAEGSIGRALDLVRIGGLPIYRSLLKLLEGVPNVDGAALHAFADRLARADGEAAFTLLGELLPGWLARMSVAAAGGEGAAALPEELPTMRRIAGRRGLDQWAELWEKLTHLFAEAQDIYLDRKQVVLSAFFALEEAAR